MSASTWNLRGWWGERKGGQKQRAYIIIVGGSEDRVHVHAELGGEREGLGRGGGSGDKDWGREERGEESEGETHVISCVLGKGRYEEMKQDVGD